MITKDQVNSLTGAKVIDYGGEKIGSVGQVFVDERNGEPAFVAVRTGMFGTTESFAPLDREATLSDGTLRISATKDQVKEAPLVEPESGHLSERSAAELYRYYNMSFGDKRGETMDRQRDLAGNMGRTDSTSPTLADKGKNLNLTRYEEQLRVGKEQVESGRVRLRKHVVTEEVTVKVPLSHEEVRIEREPVTSRTAQESGRAHEFVEESAEMTLHAERPVVSKESVAVEKVRLSKETRTEEQPVRGTVRKETIDVEDETDRRRKPPTK